MPSALASMQGPVYDSSGDGQSLDEGLSRFYHDPVACMRTPPPPFSSRMGNVMGIAGAALIGLGIVFGSLSAAQTLMGRYWFVLRKPAVEPSREQIRAGGIVGLIIAAAVVLLGLSWLPGDVLRGNVGLAIWLAFICSSVSVTLVLRVRRRRGRSQTGGSLE